jgi:hypothetical protein
MIPGNDKKTIRIDLRITEGQKQALMRESPKNVSYAVRRLIQQHLINSGCEETRR